MDFSKYNQVPTEPATAAQIGLAAATLSAMARRGSSKSFPANPTSIAASTIRVLKFINCLKNTRTSSTNFSF
jgi:hypothetical protein